MIPNTDTMRETISNWRESNGRAIRVACALALVALLLAPSVTLVAAQATTQVLDDFEDGNLNNWTRIGSASGSDATVSIESDVVAEGDFAMDMHRQSGGTGTVGARYDSFPSGDYHAISQQWNYSGGNADGWIRVTGNNGELFTLSHDVNENTWHIEGGQDLDVGLVDGWHEVRITFDYANEEATLMTVQNGVVQDQDTFSWDGGSGSSSLTGLEYETNSGHLYVDEVVAVGEPTHEVSGTVTDQDDVAVENATVEITNSSGGVVGSDDTDVDGEYAVQNLPNGTYTANVTKQGYSPTEETFEVAGEDVTLDMTLTEERLILDTRQLFEPGNTHPYRVLLETGNGTQDVTDGATVTSNNTSALTVDGTAHTMTAVDDENVSQVVDVNVTYGEFSDETDVVVAEANVENLAILPAGIHRVQAIMLDDTIFALIVAAFLSVAASRFANSFAGLAVAEMVIVVGWLAGYVGIGIAMLSIFVAMFVGLNLAENIEFTARGGGFR